MRLRGFERVLYIANHEASHVAVFHLLGFPLKSATIDPLEAGPHGEGNTLPDYPEDARPINQLRWDYATAIMAGLAFDEGQVRECEADIARAMDLAESAGMPFDERHEWVRAAVARAKGIVNGSAEGRSDNRGGYWAIWDDITAAPGDRAVAEATRRARPTSFSSSSSR